MDGGESSDSQHALKCDPWSLYDGPALSDYSAGFGQHDATRPDENRIIDVRIALGVNWSVRENFIRLAEQSFVRLVRFGYIDGHQRPPEWMHRDPLSPAPSARGLGNPQNERRTCIEKEFLELSDIVPV